MIERRRALQNRRRLARHHQSGRPRTPWVLCGDEACANPHCTSTNSAPDRILVDRERSLRGADVTSMASEFAALMASRIWRSSWSGMGTVLVNTHSIASFVASPPVRRAYLDFKTATEADGVDILSGEWLGEVLHGNVLPRFYNLLLKVRQCAPGTPETLEDHVILFLKKMEAWRARAGARWAFGSRRIVAELLVATVQCFYKMDREGCFDVEACKGAMWDEAWEAWLDTYPVLNASHEALAPRPELAPRPVGDVGWNITRGVGYLGGIGRADGPRVVFRTPDDGLPRH